mgnify:CR=1 FL=1
MKSDTIVNLHLFSTCMRLSDSIRWNFLWRCCLNFAHLYLQQEEKGFRKQYCIKCYLWGSVLCKIWMYLCISRLQYIFDISGILITRLKTLIWSLQINQAKITFATCCACICLCYQFIMHCKLSVE